MLSLSKAQDKNTLDEIAEMLTKVTQQVLMKELSLIRVDIRTASTYLAGKPTNGLTFNLSISITHGSNSKMECESWLKEANTVMRKFGFNADKSVSYLSIITLPSVQWGYNGLSQESRKLGR